MRPKGHKHIVSSPFVVALTSVNWSRVPPDHCMAPMKIGPCRGSFPRWHYNAASEKCEKFDFGGCRENLNNYLSKDECDNACSGSGTMPT